MSGDSTIGNHDLRYCTDLLRRYDYDRYITALVARPADRAYLFALYAFNHEIAKTRESVQEPMAGAIRLQWWADIIGEIREGRIRAHPVVRSLAASMGHRGLPAEELHHLIDARRGDLEDRRFDRLEDLTEYARASGGTLQRLAVRVCQGEGSDLLAAAEAVGTVWALTGIIRAISFQAALRRLQLPSEELAAAGIREGQIFRGEFPPELNDVIAKIARRAESLLDTARPTARRAGRRALPAFLVGDLARRYLSRLKRAGYAVDRLDPAGGPVGRLLRVGISYTMGRPRF